MEEHFESFDYAITSDPEFMNERTGITPELSRQMESLHKKALKGGEKNIEYLLNKIEQYPNVPQLKNYLSVAYINSGKQDKAFEVNNWIIKEHPDYLFGFLNKANEYYLKEQYEKIPELLGDLLEIQELYPDRDTFHVIEVLSFNKLAVMYFSAIGNIEAAELRFSIMEELAPDHYETEIAFSLLMEAQFEAGYERYLEEKETQYSPEFKEYNKSVQTDKAPEFENPLINELYRNDIDIDQDILREILSLPRQSLINDLKKVLWDSVCRFEYFKELDEKEYLDVEVVTFPIHAVFLLGELKAYEALENILETFRQGETYIRFWYDNFITDAFWLPICQLTEGNLDTLKDFMLAPGVYTYAKSEVSTAVMQYYYHHPEKRKDVLGWYETILNEFLNTKQDNLIDSELIALLICEIMEADLKELMPVIEKLYEEEYVAQGICGTLDEVNEDFGKYEIMHWKKDVMSIFEMYEYTLSYLNSYDDDLPIYEEPYVREEPKIGRNDPCPCGSGKKYKKCCMN